MKIHPFRCGIQAGLVLILVSCQWPPAQVRLPDIVRVATYNIEDIRTEDLLGPEKARLIEAAKIIQTLKPDVLLINEMTYDMLGSGAPGQNGQRFADKYLVTEWEEGLQGIRYAAWMPPSNTGIASGYDLNNDGSAVNTHPPVTLSDESGNPPRQTSDERAFGNDSWGFGTFPGQYGMALLIREGLSIDSASIQTYQTFRWSDLSGALRPAMASGESWYSDAEWEGMRLSSKNHVIVPIQFADGRSLKVIAAHPTPPAFDGPEMRNKKRNHDEIRLIHEILKPNSEIVSDQGSTSMIQSGDDFVVLGDMNADPDEGSSFENPIATFLLDSGLVQAAPVPVAPESTFTAYPKLDADDTAQWGLRVDYVLPSTGIEVVQSGVMRPQVSDGIQVSDHFPVWIDIRLPRPE